ncbi:hypothetical protein SGRA_1743 [Saprospira grandis str. Lewin]|uniref:Uncharacterized protein n=1 Tax=Saprospira grandis (strain Lewin) TaxID=984262 RepID=H6KZ88_SAPGL|nr:hypothetical protein SGRA_1743 [Saprospira grandis str. Lewin]
MSRYCILFCTLAALPPNPSYLVFTNLPKWA